MSKNELQRSGEHRGCGFANGAGELNACYPCLHENLAAKIFEGSAI